MSYILTYVRVALATSDVQNTLEIPATDEIHMEDRTMVLPELSRTMAYTTRNTVNRLARKELYKSCGTRTIKGGINLYIELQKHKLDQIAVRNMKISLEKRIAFSKLSYVSPKKNMIPVTRIYLLYLQTVLIIARPSVTI